MAISVAVSDEDKFLGPFKPVREEMSELSLRVRDSYGQDGILPDYSALFYQLKEISITSEMKNGLGFGPIESLE